MRLAGETGHEQAAEWLNPGDFNIVHTGTLLEERDPAALVEGFMRFVGSSNEKRQRGRLVFVGRVLERLEASQSWQGALAHANVICVGSRINYHAAMAVAQKAVATVIVESNSPESPFFPAKLSDYIWLRKPVIALTPQKSTVTDLLGPDYPLLVKPTDAAGVAKSLDLLWRHWLSGDLEPLKPPESVVASISEQSTANQLNDLFLSITGERAPAERAMSFAGAGKQ
jgi:hypothetical protein